MPFRQDLVYLAFDIRPRDDRLTTPRLVRFWQILADVVIGFGGWDVDM